MSQLDLIVVGSGPAGYVGAIRAAQLGLRTAVVEKSELGGICLNWGCIPTKALLHSADLLRSCRKAAGAGIQLGSISVDIAQMVRNSREAVGQLNGGVKHLLKKHKIAVHAGHARLAGGGEVEITSASGERSRLSARHIMLATGARGRVFPGLEKADPARIWGYREALTPQAAPKSLLVIGAGAIGMEFASFYAALGTQVQVCEMRERVLPAEDADISAFVQAAFERDGVRVRTQCAVQSVKVHADGVQVTLAQGGATEQLNVERVLVSIGVTGNVEDIGLDRVPGVAVARGFIQADAFGATGQPGVLAVGDVAGAPWLAHKASHQAVACVERLAGVAGAHAPHPDEIPACTFCHPQVASVGLSEEAARARGHRVKVGRFPFAGNGKAIASAAGDGWAKVVFDEATGALLGAHLVGEGVTELIGTFSLARQLESTEAEMMQVVFPHPTLSEVIPESVLAAFGRAIHA